MWARCARPPGEATADQSIGTRLKDEILAATFDVFDPASGALLDKVPDGSVQDALHAVDARLYRFSIMGCDGEPRARRNLASLL